MDNSLIYFLQHIFEIVENSARRNASLVGSFFCPDCGLAYGEFKDTGKLGCARCYAAFREYISHVLKTIHGTDEYKGKIPIGQGNKYDRLIAKRELAENRVLLKKAVEAEEFEQAAKYRDIINDLLQRIDNEV